MGAGVPEPHLQPPHRGLGVRPRQGGGRKKALRTFILTVQRPGAQRECCRWAEDEDGVQSECPYEACPFDELPPHLLQLYFLSLSCIEEGTKTDGEGDLKVTERTFGLSIERFRFFWWMHAAAYRLPDSVALQFWRIVAFVAEACHKAQGIQREEIWAKRRERNAAIEKLRAIGAPLPPELQPAAPRFKLKTRAERAAEERGEVVSSDGERQ